MHHLLKYQLFASISLAAALSFAFAASAGQSSKPAPPQSSNQNSMPGMDMGDARGNMGDMGDMGESPDAAKAATDAMSGPDMDDIDMAHMYMTALRPPNAADQKRADAILAALRPAIEKYKDYHVALAEDFRIFLPNIPQPIYHFTNYQYALEALYKFDPSHPTSLLYTKTKNGYTLVGAMYTDRKRAGEDDLDRRVPLSVARWHKHTNFCLPPKGTPLDQIDLNKFGLRGGITSEAACSEAGGRWFPQIFGWMVHVYPYESDPHKIWAH